MDIHPEDWKAFQSISQSAINAPPSGWISQLMAGPPSTNVIDHRAPIYQRPYYPTGQNMNSVLTNMLFKAAK